MGIYQLKGKIQHYGWGGYNFIPNLIGQQNTDNQPFAELWMGTHHKGTAEITIDSKLQSLSDFIAKQPVEILGEPTAKMFNNQLPFLFKILDVNQMLSIQAHPTKEEAVKGFARENKLGISVTAKNRNYRDDNHKPEIMVALTDFWLLHGFKSAVGIKEVLNTVPEFAFLQSTFQTESNYDLYKRVMEMSQEEVDKVLLPMKKRLLPLLETNQLVKEQADYWAALAFKQDVLNNGHEDRGIFSIYFFNLVNIKKGDGIFQDAGIPHAYLDGVNVELMANSDNVFRGGLTYKHIDVPELLKHLVFDAITPNILSGHQLIETETVFKTPAPDFELSRISISTMKQYQTIQPTAAIIILMEGEATISSEDKQIEMTSGSIVFVSAATNLNLVTNNIATLFKASVPLS